MKQSENVLKRWVLLKLIYLDPDQGVQTVTFSFGDRVMYTDVLSIQSAYLGIAIEGLLGSIDGSHRGRYFVVSCTSITISIKHGNCIIDFF